MWPLPCLFFLLTDALFTARVRKQTASVTVMGNIAIRVLTASRCYNQEALSLSPPGYSNPMYAFCSLAIRVKCRKAFWSASLIWACVRTPGSGHHSASFLSSLDAAMEKQGESGRGYWRPQGVDGHG